MRSILEKIGDVKVRRFRRVFAGIAAGILTLVTSSGLAEHPELPKLTTLPRASHIPGKFVWADLVTDDLSAATKFYGPLFGWRFHDLGGYAIGSRDELPLCGIFQRSRPSDKSAQPRWFGYISVGSVRKAESAVVKHGGKVLAASKKFPQRGEQAVFADPEGAVFGVVKSSSGDPADFKPEPGEWIWIQLISRDGRKAAEFYRQIGGYKIIENTTTNRLSDYMLTDGRFARATTRTIPRTYEQVQPTWLLFVRVASVRESVSRAIQLGGKVLIEPKPGYLEGKVAVVADPTGAAVGLLEWSEQP